MGTRSIALRSYVAAVHRLLRVALAVAALAVAGCGDDEDIGAQNERTASDVFLELEGMSNGDTAPRDVAWARPQPEHFVCRAYVEVRDGVALIAEYDVVPCEGRGFRARMRSGHDWLEARMPARFRSSDCGYSEPKPWE